MTDKKDELPFFLAIAGMPEARKFIAQELRAMAAAKGIYNDFATVSPWTVCLWHAAAEVIENVDAAILAAMPPRNDLDV